MFFLNFPRSLFFALCGALCVVGAFVLSADDSIETREKRLCADSMVKRSDWKRPANLCNTAQPMANIALDPAIEVSFHAADAYRVRLFYILRSEGSVAVRFNSREIGRLDKAETWKKFAFDAGYQPKGGWGRISFAVRNRGDLLIRVIDYRNYHLKWNPILNRWPPVFTLKPKGAPFSPISGRALALYLFIFFGVVCCTQLISRRAGGSGGRRLARSLIAPGGLAAILVLHQFVSPYPVRAHPAFLVFLFTIITIGVGTRWKLTGAKKLLPKLAVSFSAIFVCLTLAEGALRIWSPPGNHFQFGDHMEYSPEYVWVNRPGAQGREGLLGSYIRINRHGHRGPEVEEEKPPGVFRVLCLGDSFTFGSGVQDEETFPRVLEKRLRDAGYRAEVLNAGVAGWGSVQYLHYFLKNAKRFGADIAIVNFFANDMDTTRTMEDIVNSPWVRNRFYDEMTHQKRRNSISGYFRLYNGALNARNFIRRFIKGYRVKHLALEAGRRHLRGAPYILGYDMNEKYMVPLRRRVVTQWKKASRKLDTPVVFTYIPAGPMLHHPDLLGHARALEKLSGEVGLPYIDLVTPLEKHPEVVEMYLYPKDSHMSARGYAIVGETIAKSLLLMNSPEGFRAKSGERD